MRGESAVLDRQVHERGMIHNLAADLARDRRRPLTGRAPLRRDVAEIGEERLDDRADELVAAADVPVDRGVGDAEFGRELAHRERVDAAGFDQPARRGDDAVAFERLRRFRAGQALPSTNDPA